MITKSGQDPVLWRDPKKRPKRYQPGVEPAVDAALCRLRFAQERDTW